MIVRGAKRSGHRAGCPQLGDRGLVVTSLAKDLIAVLADAGWTARLAFLAAVDPDRAVDGEHGIVLERHQHVVVDHLLIVWDVVEDTEDRKSKRLNSSHTVMSYAVFCLIKK